MARAENWQEIFVSQLASHQDDVIAAFDRSIWCALFIGAVHFVSGVVSDVTGPGYRFSYIVTASSC